MGLDEFVFTLPEDRIALRPAQPRDAARLLHVRADGVLADRTVHDLTALLRAGDVLVLNDTRVTPVALSGRRPPRDPMSPPVEVEINLLRRAGPSSWIAFARPGRRLRPGDMIEFAPGLTAVVEDKEDEGAEVRLGFSLSGTALDARLAEIGQAPLPPYIARRRPADARDLSDYQTVYARVDGAVAAPTAGLHFTEPLLAALDARGIARVTVTLHVGAGTFAPLEPSDLTRGELHPERGVLAPQAADELNAARDAGRRIVAVGTTSLRLLETAALPMGRFAPFDGETRIFIRPGHEFRGAEALMTNFHLPRSSLFMLVCAFAGTEAMQRAYAHAITRGYRFYSYGDACLLERPT
jgi:S-adenosylmethionine:tRNA ribosyltransferase-isomerase